MECQKSTEIFLDWELNYLSKYLHYNIVCQNANTRNEIHNLYRKAMTRIDIGIKIIQKNIDSLNKRILLPENKTKAISLLQLYEDNHNSYSNFIKKFTKQLISYLSFDSNYLRRLITLDLLLITKNIMLSAEWSECWTEGDVQNCHSILFDSYENNRNMAVTLLKSVPSLYIGFSVSNIICINIILIERLGYYFQ